MLTDDPDRAAAIAAELDRANSERRGAEREVAEAAERARRDAAAGAGRRPGARARRRGLAPRRGRHRRLAAGRAPLAAGGAALGRGGRGPAARRAASPGFDLVAALDACSEHLVRYGGHRAAAGLELEAAASTPSARRSSRYARERDRRGRAGPHRARRRARRGRGARASGWSSPRQLERLGPFGQGNPEPAPARAFGAAARRSARWARRASTPASTSRAAPAARPGWPSG